MPRRLFISFILLAWALPLFADDEPTIGHELEFRSRRARATLVIPFLAGAVGVGAEVSQLHPAWAIAATFGTTGLSYLVGMLGSTLVSNFDRHLLLAKLRERPDLMVVGNKVIYPDGFWFKVGLDPTLVEITHKKYKPSEYHEKQIGERMQRDIYDVAASVGLHPSSKREGMSASGGHLNLGKSAFRGDPLLLLNFVLDFANHAEISTGVLVNDRFSAPALRFSKEKRERLQRLRRDFIRSGGRMDFDDVWIRYGSVISDRKRNALVPRQRYEPELARFEIRSLPTLATMDDQHKLAELFLARIEYLSHLKRPVELIDEKPSRDPHAKTRGFRRYVEESGKSWADYEPLINPAYRGYDVEPSRVRRAIGCARGLLGLGV